MSDCVQLDIDGKSHRCLTCSKSFSSNSHLRRHEAVHTRDRLNTCIFCSRTFIRHDVLRRHSKSCQQRGEHDVIASARPGRPRRSTKNGNHAQFSRLGARSTNPSQANFGSTIGVEDVQNLPPYPITFLYRYTDPRRESVLNAFDDEKIRIQSSISQESQLVGSQLLEGDMALFGIFSDLFMGTDTDAWASTQTVPGRPQTTPILQSRIDELCSQLFSYSEKRRKASLIRNDVFPSNAAKAVFIAENFEECIWAYFTVFHPQQPLLHWPTFDTHSVSLPLLLAVAFGGSVHCTPTDGALSSRSFFDLGEDFIFEHLRDVVGRPGVGYDRHALEAVQAALLVVALQSSFNNEAARRRVRVSRHPELIAAIRSLNLLEPMTSTTSSHTEVPAWNAFIAEESRVRAVYFMFVMDCMDTFFFSLLPKIAIAEVSQRLPCNDVLFDASTPEEFRRLCTQSTRLPHQKPSIKQLISSLMSKDWSHEQKDSLLGVLDLRLLMICIFALHSVLFVSRAALLVPSSHADLLRATNRWKELWDALHTRREVEHRPSLGFVKHGLEMWWVTSKVLELANAGDVQSRYMALGPTDSLSELHDFIKWYADCGDR